MCPVWRHRLETVVYLPFAQTLAATPGVFELSAEHLAVRKYLKRGTSWRWHYHLMGMVPLRFPPGIRLRRYVYRAIRAFSVHFHMSI